MYHPTDRITHTTAFVTPVVEHWLEGDIAQWIHHEGSIRRPITAGTNTVTTERNEIVQIGSNDIFPIV